MIFAEVAVTTGMVFRLVAAVATCLALVLTRFKVSPIFSGIVLIPDKLAICVAALLIAYLACATLVLIAPAFTSLFAILVNGFKVLIKVAAVLPTLDNFVGISSGIVLMPDKLARCIALLLIAYLACATLLAILALFTFIF